MLFLQIKILSNEYYYIWVSNKFKFQKKNENTKCRLHHLKPLKLKLHKELGEYSLISSFVFLEFLPTYWRDSKIILHKGFI